jgi:CTD kinase subunit beta
LSFFCRITVSALILILQIVEADRQRLMAIERLILETICFNFTSKMPFPYVIKVGRCLKGVSLFLSHFSC